MTFLSKTQLFTLFTVVCMIDLTGSIFAAQDRQWVAFAISAMFVPADLYVLYGIYRATDKDKPDPVYRIKQL